MLPNPIFLNIHLYGIMVAVGILFAFVVLTYLLKKKNIDKKFADFLFYDGMCRLRSALFRRHCFRQFTIISKIRTQDFILETE